MANSTTSHSWQAQLLVAIGSTMGAVLLAVWLTPPVDPPPSGAAAVAARLAPDASPPPDPKQGPSVAPRRAPRPVRLEIPVIDVATPLVRLGLMPDRTVEVPEDADQAGWFHHGPVPGRRGSAVVLGHVDSSDGPAVFARLQELRPGDAVAVERADGSSVRFVVRETAMYANAEFPAQRVYAAPDGRRLNLVTCGGAYDSTRGGYQSNLVVYTTRATPGRRPRAD